MLNKNKWVLLSLALAGTLGACKSESPAKVGAANAGSNSTATSPATPAADAPSMSGAVTFGGYTKEDGSAMTADELAAAIALFPNLGTNYDQIRKAVRVDVASGIVTLYDANNNVLSVIPVAGLDTIRAVQVLAGSTSIQGQCTGNSLVFDLNDTEKAIPAQEQPVQGQQPSKDQPAQGQPAQGQQPSKEQPAPPAKETPALKTLGVKVTLVMVCEQPKQQTPEQPKQQPKTPDQPKQEPKAPEQPKAPAPAPQPQQPKTPEQPKPLR